MKTIEKQKATTRVTRVRFTITAFGTLVRVTHQRSGRSVIVRINDRGPFVAGRVIDVTPAAARALGFSGLAPVTLDIVGGRS